MFRFKFIISRVDDKKKYPLRILNITIHSSLLSNDRQPLLLLTTQKYVFCLRLVVNFCPPRERPLQLHSQCILLHIFLVPPKLAAS